MAGASTPSSYSSTTPVKATASVLVLAVSEGSVLGLDSAKAARTGIEDAARAIEFRGKAGATARVPAPKGFSAESILLVGIGSFDPGAAAETAHESLRRAAGNALRGLDEAASIALALPVATPEAVEAVTVGAGLGAYRFLDYRSEGKVPGTVTVLGPKGRAFSSAHSSGTIIAEATNRARDLVNTPPLDLYPESFAQIVKAQAKDRRLKVTVLGEKELLAGGYGGLIGVGQGSTRGPRLVKVEYAPKGAKRHISLVGKGITFDSGGLSLKPAKSMEDMKSDMAGAAAVVQAVFGIADLGLDVRATAWLPLAENMPGSSAQRPSDVLHMRSGKTVEVTNTDAEGRLVLADALADADAEKPDLLIDVATLTGAQVVALGDRTSGVMGAEAAREQVTASATAAGENMWAMPIPEEMLAGFDSTSADLKNSGPRSGGMLAAAAFLQEFVAEDTNWAHVDIAGPSFNTGSAFGYTPVAATGAAVRTLIETAKARD
ncbi:MULTISPECIES: leucyl aminopeptidase [unclassified Brevibacterium]|uniref:leucyl aminopeptidase n=1 Tax=unclassified Brevibacterium TaxID=2614124 RepID=UPI001E29490C|nr:MULTISPECIES: leucyl aminopeptidase [unclassified Brevibacterium]MCD1284805.1 leucyl aminopeptidase [Brevibacterium sp. CCUG 69071]MDK8435574.1 leucyl aminopeptidase [Brevibacterium sp. H-BE7]